MEKRNDFFMNDERICFTTNEFSLFLALKLSEHYNVKVDLLVNKNTALYNIEDDVSMWFGKTEEKKLLKRCIKKALQFAKKGDNWQFYYFLPLATRVCFNVTMGIDEVEKLPEDFPEMVHFKNQLKNKIKKWREEKNASNS